MISSPVFHRDWTRTIQREWMEYLSPSEFMVVCFIFDRTIGWSKEEEKIPRRHFTEGVVSKEGKRFGRCNLKISTLKTTLASLKERKVIFARFADNCYSYSLNLEWNPQLKGPKRLKQAEKAEQEEASAGGSKSDPLEDRNLTLGGSKSDTHKRGKGKRGKAEVAAIAKAIPAATAEGDTREEIEESLERTETASRLKRSAKKAEGYTVRKDGSGLVPTAPAMTKIWYDLHTEHCPQIPCAPLPVKSVQMLRGYAREWNQRNPGKEWVEFLGWVFKNWTQICRTSFHWMITKPDSPTPSLVVSVKLRVFLEDGWKHRAKMDAIYALPPAEREIRFLMLERGITREHAQSMVRKKAEAVDAMDLVKAERAKLEAEERNLEERKRADARERINRREDDLRKVRVKGRLDAMTEEEEETIIAGMHARRRSVPQPRKPSKPKKESPPIPESFPAWDDLPD